MTNIANRRRFNAAIDLEWESARNSSNSAVSVLMLDIDFLKQYNDQYGHILGDECLINIAQTLSLAFEGPRDLLARFGGEEFIVLLPGADSAAALKVAERCQRLIQKQAIAHAQSPHDQCVTLSIGVGTATPGDYAKPVDFIDAVDQRLYAAKKNGRNRIEAV